MVGLPCSLEILPYLADKSDASAARRRFRGVDKAAEKFDIAGQRARKIGVAKQMIWTVIGEKSNDFLALM